MFNSSVSTGLLIFAVGAFTAAAAVWDWRYWRIPNKLTLPAFALGWIYQAVFHGWSGVADGALGFLCGFGVLFVLWMVGSGGGGDVKLMGALSVWLGYQLTLKVLIVSTVMVILGTVAVLLWSVLRSGFRRTQSRYLSQSGASAVSSTSVQQRQQRRVMGYAVPVALATWLVMCIQLAVRS